jgi:hypothetical protein
LDEVFTAELSRKEIDTLIDLLERLRSALTTDRAQQRRR